MPYGGYSIDRCAALGASLNGFAPPPAYPSFKTDSSHGGKEAPVSVPPNPRFTPRTPKDKFLRARSVVASATTGESLVLYFVCIPNYFLVCCFGGDGGEVERWRGGGVDPARLSGPGDPCSRHRTHNAGRHFILQAHKAPRIYHEVLLPLTERTSTAAIPKPGPSARRWTRNGRLHCVCAAPREATAGPGRDGTARAAPPGRTRRRARGWRTP